MAASSASKSTNVRTKQSRRLTGLRLAFGLGGWLAPEVTGRRAELLFTRPFASSRERAYASPLAGARLQTLQVGEEAVTVYRWGDAGRPLVLFSHGWSSYGLRVLPWVQPLLDDGYAVASFDQIAHGRSSGQHATLPGFGHVLAAVAQQLGPIDSFIGHSLGGAGIGIALASGVPARRAVLIAPPADARAATERFARLLRIGAPAMAAFQRAVQARAGVPFEEVTAQHLGPRLSTPALIVHDLADREVPWEEGERHARYWRGARLLSVTGLGHHRIVDDAAVIDAGRRFLRGETVGEPVVSTPALPYGLA